MFSSKKDVKTYFFHTSPHGSHMKIVKHVGENKKVLDIGCATGYLAKRFKGNGCYVIGIEIDEEAAKIAKQYCDDVIIGDVEDMEELPYPEGFFDVIVYGDVLEHFTRPDLVLVKFKKYLSSRGYVVASIPNVAWWLIRLKLLMGKFEYKAMGILDVTHLRFFTFKTMKTLFEVAGYKVNEVDYTGLESKFGLCKIFPTLFAHQFIIVAKHADSSI